MYKLNDNTYTNVKYFLDPDGENSGISAELNGIIIFVPLAVGNSHYAEIMRQVDAGELTIADADPVE